MIRIERSYLLINMFIWHWFFLILVSFILNVMVSIVR